LPTRDAGRLLVLERWRSGHLAAKWEGGVELAVSSINRQTEWPEEMLELTLPPVSVWNGGRTVVDRHHT
jgi:hypothetical protein